MSSIKAAADLPPFEKEYSFSQYVEQFRRVGDLAQDIDAQVNLEYMPFFFCTEAF